MENNQDKQLKLPKNIRQIGSFGDTYKIYVEDFVYTYVHQFLHEKKEEDTVAAAVLLGKTVKQDNREYVFISGAQKCDFRIPADQENEEDVSSRQQEFWSGVYQGIKEYFSDKDILGWYINLDGSSLELNPQLQQFFEVTYNRGSRFLYYEDSLERLDAFFVQEQHALQRISGYAVYYEKNPQMQEYMITEKERTRSGTREEFVDFDKREDDVAQNYRAIMSKLNEKPPRKKVQPIVYVAGVAVLAVVSATGITQIGNYQNLRTLENTLQTLSGAVSIGSADKKSNAEKENADAQSAAETQGQENTAQGTADASKKSGGQSPSENQTNTDTAEKSEDQKTGDTQTSADAKNASNIQTNAPTTDPGNDIRQNQANMQTALGQTEESGQTQTEKSTDTSKQAEAAQGADGQKPSDSSKNAEAQKTSAQTQRTYVVKKGDSLVSISRSVYKTTAKINEICELNNIKNKDMIYEGQKLILP